MRWVANGFGLLGFLVSLPLWFRFDRGSAGFQFVERVAWIPSIGVQYLLGVDGISTLLILLTTLLGGDRDPQSPGRRHRARARVLRLPAAAADRDDRGLLRARPLPVLRVLGGDAGPDVLPDRHLGRGAAALRGDQVLPVHARRLGGDAARRSWRSTSAPSRCRSTRRPAASTTRPGQRMDVPADLQFWVFLAFFVGFAIKVPMFPFHTWLPDAHVEAPTAGSVILAGVLLKMGTYGFIRFSLPLLPQATLDAVPWMATLAIIAIVYAGLVTLVQKDMKKLVAYSSVSHLGFVDARHVRAEPARARGQRAADGQPRPLDRRAVPGRRPDLRAAPHPGDRGLFRARARDAGLRDAHARAVPRLDGAAAAQRLRRRAPDPAGRLRGEPRLGLLGGHGGGARAPPTCCGSTSASSGARSRTRRTRSSRTSTAASSRRSCRSWCSASGSASTRSRSSTSCTQPVARIAAVVQPAKFAPAATDAQPVDPGCRQAVRKRQLKPRRTCHFSQVRRLARSDSLVF